MTAFILEYQLVFTTLFSGAGLWVLGGVCKYFYKRRKIQVQPVISQKVVAGDKSTVYQSGSSMIINNDNRDTSSVREDDNDK
jgi:hypothetical protein